MQARRAPEVEELLDRPAQRPAHDQPHDHLDPFRSGLAQIFDMGDRPQRLAVILARQAFELDARADRVNELMMARAELERARQANLRHALSASLLMLPERFEKKEQWKEWAEHYVDYMEEVNANMARPHS